MFQRPFPGMSNLMGLYKRYHQCNLLKSLKYFSVLIEQFVIAGF